MKFRHYAVAVTLSLTSLLTACGGGDGDNASPTPQITSYWSMDTYKYTTCPDRTCVQFAPQTIQLTWLPNKPVRTGNRFSTTTANGSSLNGSGQFVGSTVVVEFADKGEGVYNIIPKNSNALAAWEAEPSTLPMTVEITVGAGTGKGAETYQATSGQVKVSKDSSGKYHFSTFNMSGSHNITVSKIGIPAPFPIPNSPNTMQFFMADVY